jgi:anti-sigma regulatory factor (Ser/Thr protein kinase)
VTDSQAAPPVTVTISRDFTAGSTHLTLQSDRSATIPNLSSLLRAASLDAPLAVIVDLDGLVARDVVAVKRLLPDPAGPDAGAPVLLFVNPLTPGGRMARAVLPDHALICDSAASAAATADKLATTTLRAHTHLTAAATSPAAARRLVESACGAWGVDHLTGVAMVVASELVSNSVEHAGTDIDIGVNITGDGVRITVRDRTPEPPRRSGPAPAPAARGPLHLRSRGLSIVSALAADWGYVTCGEGKAVWATIGGSPRDTTEAELAGPARRGLPTGRNQT